MRQGVDVQTAETEVGRVVDQAAIFRSYGNMLDDGEIGAASVDENSGSLTLRAGYAAKGVACGIKNQRSTFGQNIGADAEAGGKGQVHDQAAGGLMSVGLHSREASWSKKLL